MSYYSKQDRKCSFSFFKETQILGFCLLAKKGKSPGFSEFVCLPRGSKESLCSIFPSWFLPSWEAALSLGYGAARVADSGQGTGDHWRQVGGSLGGLARVRRGNWHFFGNKNTIYIKRRRLGGKVKEVIVHIPNVLIYKLSNHHSWTVQLLTIFLFLPQDKNNNEAKRCFSSERYSETGQNITVT